MAEIIFPGVTYHPEWSDEKCLDLIFDYLLEKYSSDYYLLGTIEDHRMTVFEPKQRIRLESKMATSGLIELNPREPNFKMVRLTPQGHLDLNEAGSYSKYMAGVKIKKEQDKKSEASIQNVFHGNANQAIVSGQGNTVGKQENNINKIKKESFWEGVIKGVIGSVVGGIALYWIVEYFLKKGSG